MDTVVLEAFKSLPAGTTMTIAIESDDPSCILDTSLIVFTQSYKASDEKTVQIKTVLGKFCIVFFFVSESHKVSQKKTHSLSFYALFGSFFFNNHDMILFPFRFLSLLSISIFPKDIGFTTKDTDSFVCKIKHTSRSVHNR